MNSSLLNNLSVLSTKPAEQAKYLIAQIEQLGGQVISLPTIEISDLNDQTEVHRQIQQLADYDLAIFVSPNAVMKSIPLIQTRWSTWPNKVKIAAIGATTAKYLRDYKLQVDVIPETKFNSETLLAQPELINCTGKKIIIIQGDQGRELLQSTLQSRGAKVTTMQVYQRSKPVFVDPDFPYKTIFIQHKIGIIICTSNTALQNLFDLVGVKGRKKLQNMPLLVSSLRQVTLANTLGFREAVIIADNATDMAVVKALVYWQEKLHGTR